MNQNNLAREANDESPEGDQALASRVRATAAAEEDEAGPSGNPAKTAENPAKAPPIPDYAEVLRLVAEEALGRGLAGKMF